MLNPKNLKDYFYFINGEVVYNISTNNDKDGCGQKKVAYTEDGKIDESANSSIFPVVKVVTNEKKEDGTYDTTDKTYYYWYQHLIKDGDKFTGGKFVYNKHNDKDPYTEYMDIVKESVNNDIDTMVSKGYTLDDIKSNLPWWVYAQANDVIVSNGKYEKVKTASSLASDFSDNKLTTLINAKINEMVTDFVNEKLAKHGKKICSTLDVTSDAIDIDDECN